MKYKIDVRWHPVVLNNQIHFTAFVIYKGKSQTKEEQNKT